MSARSFLALLFALTGSIACDNHAGLVGMGSPVVTDAPTGLIAGLQAIVDVDAGTLTFETRGPSPALRRTESGVNAAIYGNQGVTVRIYNDPVIIGAPVAGKTTYTGNVGLRNLLAHSIGDEQGGGAPLDTMGIFVFVSSGPTVVAASSPCTPACAVAIRNAQGTRMFNGPQLQPYWHWPERLGPANGGADTTRIRRPWVFEADTQVRVFTFEVLLEAAWPPPAETRWRVEMPGDSLPHTATEPRWRRTVSGSPTVTASGGMLTLTVPAGAFQYFPRFDSLTMASNAYVEARLRVAGTIGPLTPEIAFGVDDDTRFVAAGLSGTAVGFVTTGFQFIGAPSPVTTTAFNTYQVRKFSSDSVQLWMNSTTLLQSRAYTALSPSFTQFTSGFFFGSPLASAAGNTSIWDYVVYEIGAVRP